jgi:hypothetical protein
MAADWNLPSASEGARFIINDRGFAWAEDRENGRIGLLVPLMATHALVVLTGANIAIARDALSWFAGAAARDVDSLEFGEPVVDRTPLGYSWPVKLASGWKRLLAGLPSKSAFAGRRTKDCPQRAPDPTTSAGPQRRHPGSGQPLGCLSSPSSTSELLGTAGLPWCRTRQQ